MKKINGTNLRKVELPHPPLEVQQQVVKQLSTFRHQVQAAALRRERALKVLAELVKAALSPDGAVV
jgi:restriction endonuclease S subunit